MAFRPAFIERSTKTGTDPLAYYVRRHTKKRKNGSPVLNKQHLILRLTTTLARACGMKKHDGIRLDLDPSTRQGRLIAVDNSSRHLCQAAPGRSFYVSLPYTGELPGYFPEVPTVHGLNVLQMSTSEGLIFDLPKLP